MHTYIQKKALYAVEEERNVLMDARLVASDLPKADKRADKCVPVELSLDMHMDEIAGMCN
jgi:hypothetical protein